MNGEAVITSEFFTLYKKHNGSYDVLSKGEADKCMVDVFIYPTQPDNSAYKVSIRHSYIKNYTFEDINSLMKVLPAAMNFVKEITEYFTSNGIDVIRLY